MDRLRQHIEQVTPLTDQDFENIKTCFTLKRVRKNQFLLHDGDEVKFEYLVLSGIYKVSYVDGLGKEYIVQFASKNWWMSDYHAFFKQANASMFIECLAEGEVLLTTLASRENYRKTTIKWSTFSELS